MNIGYDSDFIGDGIRIPMPTFNRSLGQSVLRLPRTLRNGIYSDHAHFSIVMNEHTKQLIVSGYNVDQARFRPKAGGKKSWVFDDRIDNEHQLGNAYYKDRKTRTGRTIPNPYDKGHMVMRFNNMWGATKAEADRAGKDTFIYSNASLQHENLNRDEWRALELNIVREFQHDKNDHLSVFTGPIYGDLDRHVNLSDQDSARVPSGFFKVICYRSKSEVRSERLGVLAFAIFQDAQVLRDKRGGSTIKTERRYQVTISEIQELTGLNFGRQLFERNPLFFHRLSANASGARIPQVPERIPIDRTEDLTTDPSSDRCDQAALSQRRIIISSAMINPKGKESRNEWVSLHNRGVRKSSVNNWRLVDGQGRESLLTGSIELGESLCLRGRGIGKIKLANKGGSLMLYDNHGCLIDHVTWSKPKLARLDEGIAFLFDRE